MKPVNPFCAVSLALWLCPLSVRAADHCHHCQVHALICTTPVQRAESGQDPSQRER
jgi:hypothetical protein